eukprot:654211-Ditylum_brightwellii.AAC.1
MKKGSRWLCTTTAQNSPTLHSPPTERSNSRSLTLRRKQEQHKRSGLAPEFGMSVMTLTRKCFGKA